MLDGSDLKISLSPRQIDWHMRALGKLQKFKVTHCDFCSCTVHAEWERLISCNRFAGAFVSGIPKQRCDMQRANNSQTNLSLRFAKTTLNNFVARPEGSTFWSSTIFISWATRLRLNPSASTQSMRLDFMERAWCLRLTRIRGKLQNLALHSSADFCLEWL